MPGSAVPTFAVRPLVAENTATSVDANALKANTTPAIANPASRSGLATPRLVVLDDYFGSRTDMEVGISPASSLFSVSATAFALALVPDSFPTAKHNTVRGRSRSSPDPTEPVIPGGFHAGDSVARAGLEYERGDEGQRSHAISSECQQRLAPPRLESPKRLQQQQQAGIQNSSGRVALRRPVRGCYPPSRD